MELTHDDVLEILSMVEASDVEYLDIEVAGTRIVVDKSGDHIVTHPAEADTSRDGGRAGAVTTTAPAPGDAPEPAARSDRGPTVSDRDGHVTIDAPMVGVFYRAPEPGAQPYVEVGDHVDEDTTVGIVEVMKVFNSITAGTSGVVVEILAENDQFVEYGQPLIVVRPEPNE